MNSAAIRRSTIALIALFAAGCAEHVAPISDIPGSAMVVKEGVGRLFYQAPDAGMIYVYDADTAQLVASQHVEQNARFVFNPSTGLATVENQTVLVDPTHAHGDLRTKQIDEATMSKTHTHRFYFVPGGKAPRKTEEAPVAPLSPTPNAAVPATQP